MIRTTRKVINLVDWVAENTDLTAEDNHNLQDDLLQVASDITEKDAEIERLKEVVKDSTDLHTLVKQQHEEIRKLKDFIKKVPRLNGATVDYLHYGTCLEDCLLCEAKRILKECE